MFHATVFRTLLRDTVVIGCLAAWAGSVSWAADIAPPPDAARDSMHGKDAIRSRGFLFEELPTPSCHASTIVEAEPGVFVAAWFGGTREGDPDVGIWVSRKDGAVWSRPEQVATWHDPEGRQQPCWNPVLCRLSDGTLMLFYKAGGSPQTWQGLVRRSTDGGRTWQVIGPVNDGQAIGAIQPSILRLGGTRLLALGRTQNKRIFRIESPDNGLTWGEMKLIDLPNPNSGTDAVTLADGHHLLVSNHTEKGRSPLNVALSTDGKEWTALVTLETEPGEYSYPAIIQAADGMVHVTYT